MLFADLSIDCDEFRYKLMVAYALLALLVSSEVAAGVSDAPLTTSQLTGVLGWHPARPVPPALAVAAAARPAHL